jgi:hypothetical protein
MRLLQLMSELDGTLIRASKLLGPSLVLGLIVVKIPALGSARQLRIEVFRRQKGSCDCHAGLLFVLVSLESLL